MPVIFISYRRDDTASTSGRIYDFLVREFGKDNIIKDIDTIRFGKDFRSEIGNLLDRAQIILAVIGREWVGAGRAANGGRRIDETTDPVRVEIEYALQNAGKVDIIPLAVDGVTIADIQSSNLPDSIKNLLDYNGIVVQQDPYFNYDMSRLAGRLKTDYRTPEEVEQERIQQELATYELEQKRAEERNRLDLIKKQRERELLEAQERLRLQREADDAATSARLAAIEKEREEREAREKAEAEVKRVAAAEALIKKNKDTISSQENPATIPSVLLITAIAIATGGYTAYLIWFDTFHQWGGGFIEWVLIVILAAITGFIGFFVGFFVGYGVAGNIRSAAATVGALVVGIVWGGIKGASLGMLVGLIDGLGIGFLAGSVVGGILGMILRKSDVSPWYVKEEKRVSVPSFEDAVKLIEAANAQEQPL